MSGAPLVINRDRHRTDQIVGHYLIDTQAHPPFKRNDLDCCAYFGMLEERTRIVALLREAGFDAQADFVMSKT